MLQFIKHLGRRGRVGALVAVVGLAGAAFFMTTAAQANPPVSFVNHGTQLVSHTDTNFDLAGCAGAPCTSHHTVAVTCPGGTKVLGGGATNVNENGPNFGNGGDVEVHQTYPVINIFGQTWAVDLTSINGATHVDATAWAICTK